MADALPIQVELSEADYLVFLKEAKRQTRVSARLIPAVELERKRGTMGSLCARSH